MIINALKSIPLFAALNSAQLAEVAALLKIKSLPKEAAFFTEGAPSQGVFILLEGEVKIVKTSSRGGEHTIRTIEPGEAFAEVVLFTGLPYPANAVCAKPSRAGFLPTGALEALIKKNPELGIQFIKVLAPRLYAAQSKNKELALDNVADRLYNFLNQATGDREPDGLCHVTLPATRSELASMLGTTRETLTRLLMALKKGGLIVLEKNRLSFRPSDLAGYMKQRL